MNEILKKRIEEAAINGSKHYDPNISKYSQGKQVGYLRGFNEGAEYVLSRQWISVEEALPEYDKLFLVKHRPICSVPYEQNNMSFARREARSYGDVWIINRQTWRVNLNNRIDNTVTHWMPIPELKLDEEDDE